MNGRKHIPNLDGYDNGESPTLSVWDEWDREDIAEPELWDETGDTP
ncbi:hypothetical protein [Streptomyces sp. MJM1172]|nr:hypothetical protein [Streptomyces sp. MJM1172]